MSIARASPPFTQCPESVEVPGYRVVVEVALNDRLEPLTGLRHRTVHSPSELLLDVLQPPHALADRLAPYRERPLPVPPAHVRESQKVERFWLSFPSPFPFHFGIPPELDPARFFRMEFQSKLPHPFPKILQVTVCVSLVLEA